MYPRHSKGQREMLDLTRGTLNYHARAYGQLFSLEYFARAKYGLPRLICSTTHRSRAALAAYDTRESKDMVILFEKEVSQALFGK